MAFLTTQLEGGNVSLARADGGALEVIPQAGSPSGGITDVTGTDPIVVTTPSPGVKNVALSAQEQALLGRLQVVFPQFTTNDNTTHVPWGHYTFPSTPVPRSTTLLVSLKGTRTDGPNESQFIQYAVSYYWNGTMAVFSDGGFQSYANLDPGGTADPEDSISGATITFTLAGPNSNPYTWTGYIQAFPDPVT